MISTKWTPQEENLLTLLRPTSTYREIAEQIQRRVDKGLAGFTVARTESAVRTKFNRESIIEETPEFEDCNWDSILKIREQYSSRVEYDYTGLDCKIARKIVSISDLHMPYVRMDLLTNIIDNHPDLDILVLNGDLFENETLSTFSKSGTLSVLDEYIMVFDLIYLLSRRFPKAKIVLTAGNHDLRRVTRKFNESLPKAAHQMFRPDLIARIVQGERLDRYGNLIEKVDFSNVYYDQYRPWFVQIGKTLFVHPWNRGSSKPGFTVNRCNDYLFSQYGNTYDSMVCGHTHQIYKGVVAGKLLIEQGCLADLLHYAHSADLAYTSMGLNGYAVIYQDAEGNTDFNASNVYYLGMSFPIKKPIIK